MATPRYGHLERLNTFQPVPAASIAMNTPVDSVGERFRKIVEFDLTSPTAYAETVARFPNAWRLYYEGTPLAGDAPPYSPDNALLLRDAIKFFLYSDDSVSINVERSTHIPGIISDGEKIRVDAPRVSPYMREGGGTYENPDAFHDQEVFDRVTENGTRPIPVLAPHGSRSIASRVVDRPHLAQMYSFEQMGMLEHEISRATPRTEWDHFGPYATGRNTF